MANETTHVTAAKLIAEVKQIEASWLKRQHMWQLLSSSLKSNKLQPSWLMRQHIPCEKKQKINLFF